MKYLLLVIYLFSTASIAGHCAKGAKHDRDHDEGTLQSEMQEESPMKEDSDAEEAEVKEENDSEA